MEKVAFLKIQSNTLGHPSRHGSQGLGYLGRQSASCHSHVRLATAFTADLLGYKIDQLTGLDLGYVVRGDASGELDFVTVNYRQHDGCTLEFVFELV
jgi:hypothetical protein